MVSRNILIGLFVFSILFFLTRLYLIEKDIPPMDISGYAQVDECYYALPALDKIKYGDFYFSYKDKFTKHSTFFGSSTLLNIICIFCLKLFGNNYWGLRFASLLISVCVLFFLFYLFKKVVKENQISHSDFIWKIGIALLFIIGSDFSFLFSNIVIEPTLIRTFIMILIIFIVHALFQRSIVSDKIYFFLGSLSLFAWVFVYLTNLFIPVSVCLIIIINNLIKKKQVFKSLLPFLLGNLASIIIIAGYIILLKIKFIEEFRFIYNSFSDRTAINENYNQISFIKKILINGFNFFRANFLNYNPLLSILFLTSVFSYFFILLKYKSERKLSVAFISLIFLSVFFIQSLLVNDFFTRKMLIAFPLYLLITFHVISFWSKNYEKSHLKILLIVVTVASSIVIFSQLTLNWIYKCEGTGNYRDIIPPAYLALTLLGLLVLLIFYKKDFSFLLIWFFSFSIMNNLYYSYSFAFKYSSTVFKDSMIRLGQTVNDKQLFGGWSNGFRLYNSSKPLLNQYRYYNNRNVYELEIGELLAENKNSYIITFKNDSLIKKFNLTPVMYILDYKCGDQLLLYTTKK